MTMKKLSLLLLQVLTDAINTHTVLHTVPDTPILNQYPHSCAPLLTNIKETHINYGCPLNHHITKHTIRTSISYA